MLRRSSPRMIVMRISTIGIIVRLSRLAETSVSKATAVLPPTKISESIAWTASRITGITSRASTESGLSARVALRMTFPSTTLIAAGGCPGIVGVKRIGSTDETPETLISAADTGPTSSSRTTTSVGCPEPPGKCSPRSSSPTTESGRCVNASAVDKPFAFNVVENPARTARPKAVIIHNLRGRFSTAEPILAQVPVSCVLTSSLRGIRGQKIQRPKATNNAGNKVRIVTTAAATPIAPTGPRPRFPDKSLSSKTSSAEITVAPDATIGSKTPFRAAFIACAG